MTDKTREEILKYTELNLMQQSKSLDNAYRLSRIIIGTNEFLRLSNTDLDKIATLLKFRMLVGFISLDLTIATRNYMQSEYQYEAIFSLRQFYVVINEGFKKIYHFPLNEKGEQNPNNRINSMWIKEIGEIINKQPNETIRTAYKRLTSSLDDYYDSHFQDIKDIRNLSIHYDEDLLKVYEKLGQLNGETTIKKFMPFYQILTQLFIFSHDVIVTFGPSELRKYG